MKKKYLIVSGCSWADPEQYSEDPKVSNDIVKNYYRWPNIVADKLNLELINFGKYASGNEYICSSLIDNITAMSEYERSNIGLVIAAWSEAKRTDFEYKENENDYYVKNIFEVKDKRRIEFPSRTRDIEREIADEKGIDVSEVTEEMLTEFREKNMKRTVEEIVEDIASEDGDDREITMEDILRFQREMGIVYPKKEDMG